MNSMTDNHIWQTVDNKQPWQAFLAANPSWAGNCLQSFNWSLSHEKLGGQVFCRVLYDGDKPIAGYMALLEVGQLQRLLTIAGGPLLDWADKGVLQSFKNDVAQIARAHGCLCVRIRPQTADSKKMRRTLKAFKFRLAPTNLSVETAGILDLKLSDEEIWNNFSQNLRRKIRKAQKDEAIEIKVSRDIRQAALFSDLHQEHAQRFHYGSFTKQKLVSQFKTFRADDEVLLYFAYRNREVLAANMIFFYGKEASYLFGVSTPLGQKHPSAPLLHLKAIAEARKRGLKIYNFWGIVGPHEVKHRYYGLSQFKRSFGVESYRYTPAYDLVIRRLPYVLFWVYLTLLRKWRQL